MKYFVSELYKKHHTEYFCISELLLSYLRSFAAETTAPEGLCSPVFGRTSPFRCYSVFWSDSG